MEHHIDIVHMVEHISMIVKTDRKNNVSILAYIIFSFINSILKVNYYDKT